VQSKREDTKLKMKHLLIIFSFFLFVAFENCNAQIGSKQFIVRLSQFTQPNLTSGEFRCVGTKIASRSIVAPASCVLIDAPMEIAVTEIIADDSGSSVGKY
jgi:hypothetical protein